MRTVCSLMVVVAMLVLAPLVMADPITPTSGVLNVTRWEGNETSQAAIDLILEGIIGTSAFLYKSDVGAADSGSLAAFYTTTYTPPVDPEDALIEYVGGPGDPFVGPTAFLLVKDGAQIPAWYLFNLTAILGWDGKEDLSLDGFWPGSGAISHVALYGGEGIVVPEPTTLLLLGAGLVGLGIVRRRR